MARIIQGLASWKRTDTVKLAVVLFFGILLIAGTGGKCYAIYFTDTVDFSGTGTDAGRTYIEIGTVSSAFTYPYSHIIDFNPEAQSITSAILTISHKGNSANPGEAWFISDERNLFLGTLFNSTSWVDQAFVLPSDLLSGISGNTWTLALILKENTTGMDKLWIDKSVVTGDYSPVPIPSAAWLLGSGIIGLIGLKRRGIKRNENRRV